MAGTKQKMLLAGLVPALLMLPALAAPVFGDETVFVQEGRQLYKRHCSGCHGSVEDSSKAGRSMTRIRSAIRIQATHRPLSALTDEEILQIAIALREVKE